MTQIPDDFGGLLGYWLPDGDDHVIISRYANGKPVEGLMLDPVNLLQLQKLVDSLVEHGRNQGTITDELMTVIENLGPTKSMPNVRPRKQVEEILGKFRKD